MSDAPERLLLIQVGAIGDRRVYEESEYVGDEYIRKEVADKEKAEAIEYYHSIEESCNEHLKEILQPIRDIKNHIVQDEVRNAIRETLERAASK